MDVTVEGCDGNAVVVLVTVFVAIVVPWRGWGRQQPLANGCIHITRVLQRVLGACQAAIGATREWIGEGRPPCGESGGDDNINDIDDNDDKRDIQSRGAGTVATGQ
jgi:hypothetical protein